MTITTKAAHTILHNFASNEILTIEPLGGLSSENSLVSTKEGDQFVLKKISSSYSCSLEDILHSYHLFATMNVSTALPLKGGDGKEPFLYEGETYLLFPFIQGITHHEDTVTPEALKTSATILASIHQGYKSIEETQVKTRSILDYPEITSDDHEQLRHESRNHPIVNESLQLKDEIKKKFIHLLHVSIEKTLIHGDFHNGNLIFDNQDKMATIIDLELCTVGDPGKDYIKFIDLCCCNTGFATKNIELAKIFVKAYREHTHLSFNDFNASMKRYFYHMAQSTFFENGIVRDNCLERLPYLKRDIEKLKFYSESIDWFSQKAWK